MERGRGGHFIRLSFIRVAESRTHAALDVDPIAFDADSATLYGLSERHAGPRNGDEPQQGISATDHSLVRKIRPRGACNQQSSVLAADRVRFQIKGEMCYATNEVTVARRSIGTVRDQVGDGAAIVKQGVGDPGVAAVDDDRRIECQKLAVVTKAASQMILVVAMPISYSGR